jgi:hypothetical protein
MIILENLMCSFWCDFYDRRLSTCQSVGRGGNCPLASSVMNFKPIQALRGGGAKEIFEIKVNFPADLM